MQYFHGVQSEISSRSQCSAQPLFKCVMQLAIRVTDTSHHPVRLLIYLCALYCFRVSLMESHLWLEVLAECHELPSVIPAPWREVTYLLQSCWLSSHASCFCAVLCLSLRFYVCLLSF